MAEEYLDLSLKLDVSDAEKTAKNLKKEIEGIFNSGATEKSSALTRVEQQMKDSYNAAEKLRTSLEEVGAAITNTEGYIEAQREIEKTEGAITSMLRSITKAEAQHPISISSILGTETFGTAAQIEAEIENTRVAIQEAQKMGYETDALEDRISKLRVALAQHNAEVDDSTISYNGAVTTVRELKEQYDAAVITMRNMKAEQQNLYGTTDVDLQTALSTLGELNGAYNTLSVELDKVTDKEKHQIITHREIERREQDQAKKIEERAAAEQAKADAERQRIQERLEAHKQEQQIAEQQWKQAVEQEELNAKISQQHQQQLAEQKALEEAAKQKAEAEKQAQLAAIEANSNFMSLMMGIRSITNLIPGVSGKAVSGVLSLMTVLKRFENITWESFTTAIMTGIQQIGSAIKSILSFIISHPIVLVIAAIIAAIVALIQKIKELWDETEKEVDELFKKLGDALVKLKDLAVDFAGSLVEGFLKIGNFVPSTFLKLTQKLIDRLKSLKSLIQENIKEMAKWNHGNNEINKALSNITSSLAYLKASITAAVAPIIVYVEPMLTRLIDLLAKVFEYIGMIIAKITGATSFQRAIRKQKDYAKSLEETNGQLASFDKLNVISQDKSAVDFGLLDVENSPLPDWLEDFEKLGNKLGKLLKKFLKNINWDKIKQKAGDLGTNIAKFINGFFEIPDLGATIGKTLGEGLNTITTLINNFLNEFDGKKFGEQIGAALETMITTIHWDEIGSIFSGSLNKFVEMLNGFFTEFKGEDAGMAFTTFLQNALGKIKWEGPDGIKSTIALIAEDIAGFFNEVLTPENFGLIGTTLGETLNTILTGVDVFVHKADWTKWGEGVAEGIMSFIRTTDFEKLGQDAGNLVLGVLQMIKSAIISLSDPTKRQEIVDAIVDFFRNVPWVEIARAAKDIGASIRDGLKDAWEELKKNGAYDDIIYFIVEFLEEKKNWDELFAGFEADVVGDIFWKKIERVFTRVAQHIESAIETIWNFIVDVATNIGSFFDDFVFGDASFEDWLNGKAPKQLAAKGIKMNQGTLTGADLSKVPLAKSNRMVRGGTVPVAADLYAGGKISTSDTANLPLSNEAAIEQAVGKAIQGTEIKVTFDVQGDPNGLFKVVQKESNVYYKQTGKFAFNNS